MPNLIGDQGRGWRRIDDSIVDRLNREAEALERRKPKAPEIQEHVEPIVIPSNIDKSKYIQIPNTRTLISEEEVLKAQNWKNFHFSLQENGLYMPRIDQFMKYFLSLRDAAAGNIQLQYASGTQVPRERVQELWNYVSSTKRENNRICWTYLDAKFEKTDTEFYLLTNHRVKIKDGTKVLQPQTREILESQIGQDTLVDLIFNRQGLPTRESRSKAYSQGKNIRYWFPRADRVAWFNADSNRADLGCNRGPDGSDSRLGVFACADF